MVEIAHQIFHQASNSRLKKLTWLKFPSKHFSTILFQPKQAKTIHNTQKMGKKLSTNQLLTVSTKNGNVCNWTLSTRNLVAVKDLQADHSMIRSLQVRLLQPKSDCSIKKKLTSLQTEDDFAPYRKLRK